MSFLDFSGPISWALLMFLKSLFFGGWAFARWLAWLLAPLWVAVAALGAACGILAG